jgi:tetratricopeptide (TPR) repeat protein
MGDALERAEAALSARQLDLAEPLYRQHLAIHPEDSRAHARLATCLGQLRRLDEALAEAKLAVRHDPLSDFARSSLATLLYQAGDYRNARAELEEAVRLNANAPTLVMLGEVQYQLQEFQETLRAAERALALEPNFAHANSLRARALARLGRRAEARADVSRSLADSPESEVFHHDAGWVFFRAGDYGQAREHFQQALRRAPDYEAARLGLAVVTARDHPRHGRAVRLAQRFGRLPRWGRLAYVALLAAGFYALRRYDAHLRPHVGASTVRVAQLALVLLAGVPLVFRCWYAWMFLPRLRSIATN